MRQRSDKQICDSLREVIGRADLLPWQKCTAIHKATANQDSVTALDVQRALLFLNCLLGGWRDIVIEKRIWENQSDIIDSLGRLFLHKFRQTLIDITDALIEEHVDISSPGVMNDVIGMYHGEPGDNTRLRSLLEKAVLRSGCTTHETIMEEFVQGISLYLGNLSVQQA